MKSKRHSPQQIVHKLRQAEARLSAGASIPEICRELGISARRPTIVGETNMAG